MKPETARKAAKWWADHLRDTGGVLDNGARDPVNLMANSMATNLARMKRAKMDPAKVDAFEAALAATFERNDSGGTYGARCGSVDYGPDIDLYQAAQDAGLDLEWVLPFKTGVWVRGDAVYARAGYGAAEEEVK